MALELRAAGNVVKTEGKSIWAKVKIPSKDPWGERAQ